MTHVNFFTPVSLRVLMQHAGLRVASCRLAGYLNSGGQWLPGVLAVGMAGSGNKVLRDGVGVRETEGFLEPDLGVKLARNLCAPATIPGALAYRVRRALPWRQTSI